MVSYAYTRALTNGAYDLNNPARLDGGSEQKYLSKEICDNVGIPNCKRIVSNGTSCDIYFDSSITAGEETTLTSVVNAHKNNT